MYNTQLSNHPGSLPGLWDTRPFLFAKYTIGTGTKDDRKVYGHTCSMATAYQVVHSMIVGMTKMAMPGMEGG